MNYNANRNLSPAFRAMRVAVEAHSKQVRKYTGEPYTVHLLNVADIVDKAYEDSLHSSTERTHAMIAAMLHDTLEDTDLTANDLRVLHFHSDIVDAVVALTDCPPEAGTNREARKLKDFDRITTPRPDKIQRMVHSIKAADIVDNLDSIIAHETKPKYMEMLARECGLLVSGLTHAEPTLKTQAMATLYRLHKRIVELRTPGAKFIDIESSNTKTMKEA